METLMASISTALVPPSAPLPVAPPGDRSDPPPGSRFREVIFWRFQFAYWNAVAITLGLMSYAVRPEEPLPWADIVGRVLTGFLASSVVHWLFSLPPLATLGRPIRWPAVMAAMVVALVGGLFLAERLGIRTSLNWAGPALLGQIVPRIVSAGLWLAVYFGLELLDGLYATQIDLAEAKAAASQKSMQALQLEAVAREQELRRLQERVNPHFLFNALNAIVAQKDRPSDVERVVQDLADYLRGSLREARLLEPLARELESLEKYLAVQQARFRENLVCSLSCDRDANGVLVPPMMIQPLLENAIAYGPHASPQPLRIEVSARVAAGMLEVDVINSGRWVEPDSRRSPGTGIQTLRKRLELLVGPAATVTVGELPDGRQVRARITMPATFAAHLH